MRGVITYNLFVLLLLFAFNKVAASQPAEDLPVLQNVVIKSSVQVDDANNLFYYSSMISNPSTNTGQISLVEVDISKPEHSKEIGAEGLVVVVGISRFGNIISRSFNEELSRKSAVMKKDVVPVGINPPQGWDSGISVRGTVLWGSSEEKFRLMPGQSLEGYEIASEGIPALRDITVHPKWLLVVGSVSEEDVEMSKQIKEEIAFRTKTVGPTAPPLELVPLDFLENIISMKHEAVSLGWITNKGIEMGLDQKLEAVKNKLRQGNNGAARNILRAFIHEVEAQGCPSYDDCPKGKHLKPEAYAILKYNAQYLVDNLK